MPDQTLVYVLGDQLTRTLSSLKGMTKADTVILMAEVHDEATYVRHHKKKIAFLFSAMRHFAAELDADGWSVDYVKLGDKGDPKSFTEALEGALERHDVGQVRVTEPGEWRVLKEIEGWADRFDVPVEIKLDDRFICDHAGFAAWAKGRKSWRMEYFYREMRARTGLLMKDGEPVGERWNFDAQNRKPAAADMTFPKPPRFEPDAITQEVLSLVETRFADHFGDLEPFWFAVTAKDAEAALDHFIEAGLPAFGDYQDAMLTGERFLYHSVLSMYLNAGLLDPVKMCRAAEAAYAAGAAPSTQWKASFARSSAGANTCAASTGRRCRTTRTPTRSMPSAIFPSSTGRARPTCTVSPKRSARRARTPMPTTSSA